MGDLANVLNFPQPLRRPAPEPYFERALAESGLLEPARLVPGCARNHRKKPPHSVAPDAAEFTARWDADDHLLPASLFRLRPPVLAAALSDVTLISLLFWRIPKLLPLSDVPNTWLIYVAGFLLTGSRFGLYKASRARLGQSAIFKTLLSTTGFAALSLHSFSVPKLAQLFLLSVVVSGALILGRHLQRFFLKNPKTPHNALIIGAAAQRAQLSDAFEQDPAPVRSIKAFLADEDFSNEHGAAMLQKIARLHCMEEVIIASRDLRLAENILLEARRNHLDVSFALPFGTLPIESERAGSAHLVTIHRQYLPEWQLAAKRTLDLVIASLAVIFLSPVLLVIALLIRLDSPGPAIYRSTRIGLRGRKFLCYKFRTMFLEADAAKKQLRTLNERCGAFFKIANDPRITRAGRWLRRYSLDELPQLFNVLRGDMSLVGPRPHPVDDVEGYRLEHMQRLDAVPGMTGLWQVTARQDPSFDRCVELDVEYIKRWTPLLDLRILCGTISCVLQGSGV